MFYVKRYQYQNIKNMDHNFVNTSRQKTEYYLLLWKATVHFLTADHFTSKRATCVTFSFIEFLSRNALKPKKWPFCGLRLTSFHFHFQLARDTRYSSNNINRKGQWCRACSQKNPSARRIQKQIKYSFFLDSFIESRQTKSLEKLDP